MNMKGQENYCEPESEISTDSVSCSECDVKDQSIIRKLSNFGKWRLFLSCLATIVIQLIFLKVIFREPRINGLLSLFFVILTTGILFSPTLPILAFALTRWTKRII